MFFTFSASIIENSQLQGDFYGNTRGLWTIPYIYSPVPPQLSTEEQEHVKKLVSMPLNSILIDKKVRKECNDLGQKLFDEIKAAHNGDSLAAEDAVKDAIKRICDDIYSSCNDGSLRKGYVELAWAGIGDARWRWEI